MLILKLKFAKYLAIFYFLLSSIVITKNSRKSNEIIDIDDDYQRCLGLYAFRFFGEKKIQLIICLKFHFKAQIKMMGSGKIEFVQNKLEIEIKNVYLFAIDFENKKNGEVEESTLRNELNEMILSSYDIEKTQKTTILQYLGDLTQSKEQLAIKKTFSFWKNSSDSLKRDNYKFRSDHFDATFIRVDLKNIAFYLKKQNQYNLFTFKNSIYLNTERDRSTGQYDKITQHAKLINSNSDKCETNKEGSILTKELFSTFLEMKKENKKSSKDGTIKYFEKNKRNELLQNIKNKGGDEYQFEGLKVKDEDFS